NRCSVKAKPASTRPPTGPAPVEEAETPADVLGARDGIRGRRGGGPTSQRLASKGRRHSIPPPIGLPPTPPGDAPRRRRSRAPPRGAPPAARGRPDRGQHARGPSNRLARRGGRPRPPELLSAAARSGESQALGTRLAHRFGSRPPRPPPLLPVP